MDAYSKDEMSEEDADILKWGSASIYFGESHSWYVGS